MTILFTAGALVLVVGSFLAGCAFAANVKIADMSKEEWKRVYKAIKEVDDE